MSRADLDEAVIESEDPVDPFDERVGMVGDDDGRAIFHQVAQRFVDGGLGFLIYGGSRFVEDQYRGIANQRSRNGDALALAAR